MIVDRDERRGRRRRAGVFALAALTATLAAGGSRSEPSLTWERLAQMGAGIDFPHVRGARPIFARLDGTPRSYVIADGSPQPLYFYRATNCYRGEERANEAWIDCGAEFGSAVYIPVLFVTPASRPRSGTSAPADLVLKPGKSNSLEHYVPEPPNAPQSAGHANVVWVRLDNQLGGLKSSLAAPAVSAAVVLCMPFASAKCRNTQLANLADDSGEAAAAPPAVNGPPPAAAGPRPPVNPAGPATSMAASLPRGPGPVIQHSAADRGQTAASPVAPAVNPPPAPEAGPRPPVNPASPAMAAVASLPRGPGLARPPASPPPAAGLTPGRWLLGLYGPRNIGGGVDASAGAIADAQDQILMSLTRFLDDFHAQDFKSPTVDLVFMTGSDASPAFAEKSVITGTSRRPRSDRLQLDHEGDRRVAAFLSGPGSAGAEASFKSVADMITRYGQAAGESAGQRPPVAIYVGAARPRPESCPEWKKMTADVAAGVSGRPRVFGIVFASTSAGRIDEQLGRSERGDDEVIADRTRAATCNGEGGSALLFVSFPDLIAQTPESMLAQVFGAIRRRAEKVEN